MLIPETRSSTPSVSELDLKDMLHDAPPELSLDTETTGLTWKDTAFMISYAWVSPGRVRTGYIDVRTDPHLWAQLRDYINIVHPILVFHNAKFDMHKLNFYPEKFEDTCLMIYLLNEHHVKGLKPAAEKILGETTDESKVLDAELRKLKIRKRDGYGAVPVNIISPYARKDAEFTIRLWFKLKTALEKIPTVEAVYHLEKQLILDVCEIEKHGLKIDRDYVERTIRSMGDKIVKCENRIKELANKAPGQPELNPRSPKQLMKVFEDLGFPIESTNAPSIAGIDHELATLVVEMRKIHKLRNTYLSAMLLEEVDDIVHPNFNLTRTVTKRLSSSGVAE